MICAPGFLGSGAHLAPGQMRPGLCLEGLAPGCPQGRLPPLRSLFTPHFLKEALK